MTDTTDTTDTTSVPVANADNITIDTANVLHDVSTVATDARKDAERDTRHGLSHLEDEFIAEWHKLAAFSESEAKKLLAWVAGKL